ncbi:MAG: hypothetical protein IJ124_06360 [Clostridia bacterium]|nr:hypothetical protein [Clostridia bacterium]MBQ8109758.1 hypothetical protein [Clostridia bacterium]MBQ9039626.1 hypothetical protein [Clostridia bacterium]MBQ9250852.1 hypothetical protein [Oscillospiraceae bacterium]
MIVPIVEFQGDEPRESLDLAKVSLLTASQLLGDALKIEMDPEVRDQVTDILDKVDNCIEALRDVDL